MAEQPSHTSSERMSNFVHEADVPQSVFFYLILGVISSARKLMTKAVDVSNVPADTRYSQWPPAEE